MVEVKIAGVSFPVALAFVAGWLAMVAVQNSDDSSAWTAFYIVLSLAVIFDSVWLYYNH